MGCGCRQGKKDIRLEEIVELARRLAQKEGQRVYVTRCRNGNYDLALQRPHGGCVAVVVG